MSRGAVSNRHRETDWLISWLMSSQVMSASADHRPASNKNKSNSLWHESSPPQPLARWTCKQTFAAVYKTVVYPEFHRRLGTESDWKEEIRSFQQLIDQIPGRREGFSFRPVKPVNSQRAVSLFLEVWHTHTHTPLWFSLSSFEGWTSIFNESCGLWSL